MILALLLSCRADKDPSGAESHPPEDSGAHTGDTGAPEDPVETWEATQGLDLVTIPPGVYTMGCPEDEVGRWVPEELGGDGTDREFAHEVTMTHPTRVWRAEVTQAEFIAWMAYNPSGFTTCGEDCPVENLTWHEGAAFANTLSAAAGLDPCYTCAGEGAAVVCEDALPSPYDCRGYRLPTEAEWEYAARAGETHAFLGGGDLVEGTEEDCGPELLLDDGSRMADLLWYCGSAESTTHPVSQLPANAWGLTDVQGNVHEWTTDWYQDDWYLDPAYVNTDPVGPSAGAEKVRRGGAYAHEPRRVRLAYRGWHAPDEPADQVGIRLVRVVE